MSERLAFGYGTTGHGGEAPARAANPAADATVALPHASALAGHTTKREETDWAFTGLLAFTAILFLRPQEQFPPLNPLHLAEVSALLALAAMVTGRIGRGLSVTRYTPELGGVLGLGFTILATAPFSIWMGGSVSTFTEIYSKIILIFILMLNTLTNPKRIDRFLWLIVVASGYIATRAVLDYARGVNLVENGRVQGSVGGMFKNPNDLALNMVAVLPLAAFLVLRPSSMVRRGFAALCAVMMTGAIVASQSRSGTLGLAAMGLVLGGQVLKRKPGLVLSLAFVGLLALPLLPSSYWGRLESITNKDLDQTGSREARSVLLQESFAAFMSHPL